MRRQLMARLVSLLLKFFTCPVPVILHSLLRCSVSKCTNSRVFQHVSEKIFSFSSVESEGQAVHKDKGKINCKFYQ